MALPSFIGLPSLSTNSPSSVLLRPTTSEYVWLLYHPQLARTVLVGIQSRDMDVLRIVHDRQAVRLQLHAMHLADAAEEQPQLACVRILHDLRINGVFDFRIFAARNDMHVFEGACRVVAAEDGDGGIMRGVVERHVEHPFAVEADHVRGPYVLEFLMDNLNHLFGERSFS